jgi:hypothetical protein
MNTRESSMSIPTRRGRFQRRFELLSSSVIALAIAAPVWSTLPQAGGPDVGAVVPAVPSDLGVVLASVQAARLELAGIEFRSLVEEFVPAGGATAQRFFEEHIVVQPAGASISQAYTIAAGLFGNTQPSTVTNVAAFEGDVAMTWSSNSLEAVFVSGASKLPSFSPEYSFFTAWFPVPYNAVNTSPVDLVDMLASGELEVAPYTQAIDGVSCIVLRTPNAVGLRWTLWLDPTRSWFPRLHRIEDDAGIVAEWHIDAFASSGPDGSGGAWIPSSGTYRMWDKALGAPADGPLERRLSLVSGPTVPIGSDLIAVPDGSTVIDAALSSAGTASTVRDIEGAPVEATNASAVRFGPNVHADVRSITSALWLGLLGGASTVLGAWILLRDRVTG